jgi:hypothetical protein
MVQAAVNEGVARGKYGRVVLKGNFNFGDCASCIEIAGPVTIEGEGNPSGQALPDPSLVTTIDSGAIAPFVINDESEKGGTIRIERLWFRSSQLIAVNVSKLNSQLDFEQNRFTGITGQDTLRFAIGGAAIGPLAGNLKGSLRVVDNHIDTRAITFDLGDDNGIAFAMCEFERAEVLDNRIYTRGEGVEFEGCHNSKSTIEIVGNDLITDATKSTLAPLSVALGIQGVGGHPAVLKVVGTEAKSVLIADNEVQLTGEPTAICIMPGLVNRKGSMSIQNNHCKMDGQFAAVLAGWAGAPIFFPPFYLQNSVVEDNVFEGSGQFGVAFADFDWIPNSGGDEVNKGNRNLFQNNSFDNFTADQAALYFGPTTFKNEYIGNPNGIVIDLGKRNQVVPD